MQTNKKPTAPDLNEVSEADWTSLFAEAQACADDALFESIPLDADALLNAVDEGIALPPQAGGAPEDDGGAAAHAAPSACADRQVDGAPQALPHDTSTGERKLCGFDAATAPLTIPTLLEASAGTGKTFSIKHLVLRIVVELEIPMDAVLVASFTRAATAELKQRIRQHLSEMCGLLDGSLAPGDVEPLLLTQLSLWRQAAQAGDEKLADDAVLRKLKHALAIFDNAPILTIHSFCQRMLREHAFSAASAFDDAKAGDASSILEEVVEDFLRRELDAHPGNAAVARLLAEGEDWTGKLDKLCSLPAELVPRRLVDDDGLDLSAPPPAKRGSKKSAASTSSGGTEERGYLLDMLERFCRSCPADVEKRKRERGAATFSDFLVGMWHRLRNDEAGTFTRAVRKACRAVLIDEFQDTDPLQFDIFKRLFIDAVPTEEEKASPRALFFVGDPKQAIYKFRSADLNTYLAAKALIARIGRLDSLKTNFRSTPGLVEAFNRYFGLAGSTASGPFLNPDLNYEAVESTPSKTGLYRLSAERVWAPATPLEIWGAWGDRGFCTCAQDARDMTTRAVAEEIAKLLEAAAMGQALLESGDESRTVTHLAIEKDGKIVETPMRPVAAADIAVLVRAHSDAAVVRAELAKHGIRARLRERRDVMDTAEARELYLVLAAVNSPGDERALRAARATRFIGDALSSITSGGEARRIEIRSVFEESLKNWRHTGVAAAFEGLMERFRVTERLLKTKGGERTIANYSHLIEVLHAASRSLKTPSGLLTWFDREIVASIGVNEPEDESRRLRLESDDNVVTIDTIHSSKGLQYPIVYLPYAQALTPQTKKTACLLDYPDGLAGGMVLRISNRRAPGGEADGAQNLEETARLAYVAMTRAAKQLVIVCPYFTTRGQFARYTQGSAYMRILQGSEGLVSFEDVKQAVSKLGAPLLGPGEISRAAEDGRPEPIALRELAELDPGEQSAGTVLHAVDAEARAAALCAAPAQAHPAVWRVSSFSKLAGSMEDQPEARRPFYGQGRPEVLSAPDIMRFPAGAQPGTCLHAIFEHADFRRHAAGTIEGEAARIGLARAMVERHLAIADELKKDNAVKGAARMLFDVLNAEIAPGIRLRDVPPEHRFAEMEFLMHLNSTVTPELLAQALALLDPKYAVPALSHEKLKGFMTGFIDLAMAADGRYWVVDWKSNAIAPEPEGFTQEAMDQEMTRHHYRLQYLIYLVALRRLLKARLGKHFRPDMIGGAIYVFVRGVRANATTAEHPQGIVRDEVRPEVLEMLDEIFSRGVPAKLMRRALQR